MRIMKNRSGSRLAALGVLLFGSVILATACSPKPGLGEVEEEAWATAKVPAVVRDTATSIETQIGAGHCENWFWDHEDQDWECEFVGLSRAAELDIRPDGQFEELELVYSLAEIEESLPDEADTIHKRCRGARDVLVELSLRRRTLLDAIPELAEAWTKSGVVLEFQCPNGVDYELDARHKSVMTRVDDKQDASTHEKKPE